MNKCKEIPGLRARHAQDFEDATTANKIAWMAHDGLARAVRPAHTMFDGIPFSLYQLANGKSPM